MEKTPTKAMLIMHELSNEIYAATTAKTVSDMHMASVNLNEIWHELLTILADANMLYEEDK